MELYSCFVSVTSQRFKIQTLLCERCAAEVIAFTVIQLGYSMTPPVGPRSIKLSMCQLSYGLVKQQIQSGKRVCLMQP